MNKLEFLINNPIAATFGQTIMHSIWQGALIVLIYFFVQKNLKSASLKVNMGLAAFVLQMAVSIFTFFLLIPSSSAQEPILKNIVGLSFESSSTLIESIQANAHWLFAGWILGFAFLTLRLFGGMLYVQFLKQSHLGGHSPKLKTALSSLSRKIEESIPEFSLFESEHVSSAMVLGHLKPIILLPVALVSSLSLEQLEVILAHEIAHIKRFDFLLNLAQTLLESIFFYHPAFWLVSLQIRDNREHACDDWASEITGDRVLLAKTLAQIQLTNYEPKLAMNFGKKRTPMLHRIQRLLGQQPKNQKAKLTALLLMLTTIVIFSFTPNEKIETFDEISVPAAITAVTDTDVEPNLISEIPPTPKEEEMILSPIENKSIIPLDSGIQDLNYKNDRVNFKTDNYDVRIDNSGISVNGEKLDLNAKELSELQENLEQLELSQQEVNEIGQTIGKEGAKIAALVQEQIQVQQINPMGDPEFKEAQEIMTAYGIKIGAIAQEYGMEIAQLDPNVADYEKQVEELSKVMETKMEGFEEDMSEYEKVMEEWGEKMADIDVNIEEELEIPLKEIEAIIKVHEVEIEAAVEKLEIHHDAIIELLPKEVKEEIETIERFKPSKPAKPEKPEKPTKPVKVSKTPDVPAAPPAPSQN